MVGPCYLVERRNNVQNNRHSYNLGLTSLVFIIQCGYRHYFIPLYIVIVMQKYFLSLPNSSNNQMFQIFFEHNSRESRNSLVGVGRKQEGKCLPCQ